LAYQNTEKTTPKHSAAARQPDPNLGMPHLEKINSNQTHEIFTLAEAAPRQKRVSPKTLPKCLGCPVVPPPWWSGRKSPSTGKVFGDR
jgi:hypothetical protein